MQDVREEKIFTSMRLSNVKVQTLNIYHWFFEVNKVNVKIMKNKVKRTGGLKLVTLVNFHS